MSADAFEEWARAHEHPENLFFAKRLAASDTSALSSHQRGPAVPRDLLLRVFGPLVSPNRSRNVVALTVDVGSHRLIQQASANWYDLKTFGGLRRESRVSAWRPPAPVTSPQTTGSLAILVFQPGTAVVALWLCRSREEERRAAAILGPVEPGWCVTWQPGSSPPVLSRMDGGSAAPYSCNDIAAHAILSAAAKSAGDSGNVDDQFVRTRTHCIESVAALAGRLNPAARTELALELLALQLAALLCRPFSADFVAARVASASPRYASDPTVVAAAAVASGDWPVSVPSRGNGHYFLTLQEGIDATSCDVLSATGVTLIVPEPLHNLYPAGIRTRLMTLTALRQRITGQPS